MVLLEHLKPGQRGRICRVTGHARVLRRLAEYGVQPGAEVEMIRPGCVSIIRMNGGRLCLRGSNHIAIFVVPDPLGEEVSCSREGAEPGGDEQVSPGPSRPGQAKFPRGPVSPPADGCPRSTGWPFRWRFRWGRRQ